MHRLLRMCILVDGCRFKAAGFWLNFAKIGRDSHTVVVPLEITLKEYLQDDVQRKSRYQMGEGVVLLFSTLSMQVFLHGYSVLAVVVRTSAKHQDCGG